MDNSAPDYAKIGAALPALNARLGPQRARVAAAALGGLPTPVWQTERAGDAGEGIDLPVPLRPAPGRGHGDSYTPVPGVLPQAQQLDYIQKLASASLLSIGFLALLGLLILKPRRAGNLIAAGAKGHARIS